MAVVSSNYRRPRGFVTGLVVLGGLDLLLSLADGATAAVSLSGRSHLNAEVLYSAGGLVGAILIFQMILRVPQLVVRSLWARRLVLNIHLFQRFPVSPQWAWGGFFVPVASLWLPGRTVLSLARASGPRHSLLDGLCLAWAAARWLNCLSGAFLLLMAFAILHPHWTAEYGLQWMLTLEGAGIVSATLGIALTLWITRRQPTPEQLDRAEVFT